MSEILVTHEPGVSMHGDAERGEVKVADERRAGSHQVSGLHRTQRNRGVRPKGATQQCAGVGVDARGQVDGEHERSILD